MFHMFRILASRFVIRNILKMILLRLLPLFGLARCYFDFADPFWECPVIDLNMVCIDRCEADQLQCILDCPADDVNCLSACIREVTECVNACPCELNCHEGCEDCANPVCDCVEKKENDQWNRCIDENGSTLGRCIYDCEENESCETDCLNQFKTRQTECPCEENCRAGCPCDGFPCTETTTTPAVTTSTAAATTTSPVTNAVLVLSTLNAANKPMIVGWDGTVNDDIGFEYVNGADVNYGCGAILMGEYWYFGGGSPNKRQVSKIDGCQLVRQADMGFDFYEGSCQSFDQPTPKILLCFDYDHPSECHTFNGQNFETVESSKFSHRYTLGMAYYNGKALTTGCDNSSSCYIKTEIMDMSTLEWSNGPDYSLASRVCYYSTAATTDTAYIIGGHQGSSSYSTTIAQFKNNKWSKVGDLTQGRYSHGSISVGTETMVIGGSVSESSVVTEVWELEEANQKVIDPSLPDVHYAYGIALYPVDKNFCKK